MTRNRHKGQEDTPNMSADPPPPADGAGEPPQPAPLPPAEDLAAQRDDLTAQRDDLMNRLQRLAADYANYQKRVQRELAETREFANAELIRAILAVLDDMERALKAGRASHPADDPLLTGTQLAYDKALEVLGQFGLKPIAVVGEPFDPGVHDAVLQQPSREHQAPTVLEEVQRGYELKGRVLRPARVVVSAPGQAPPAAEDEENL